MLNFFFVFCPWRLDMPVLPEKSRYHSRRGYQTCIPCNITATIPEATFRSSLGLASTGILKSIFHCVRIHTHIQIICLPAVMCTTHYSRGGGGCLTLL